MEIKIIDSLKKIENNTTKDAGILIPEKIENQFIKGFLISMPFIFSLFFLLLSKYSIILLSIFDINVKKFILISFIIVVLSIISLFIHEFLHSLFYNDNEKKRFYIYLKGLSIFFVTNERIKKNRYIWMALFPNIVLGVFPIFICFFQNVVNEITFIISLVSFINVLSGIGDYYCVYSIINKTPKNSYIYNNGISTYYISDSEPTGSRNFAIISLMISSILFCVFYLYFYLQIINFFIVIFINSFYDNTLSCIIKYIYSILFIVFLFL